MTMQRYSYFGQVDELRAWPTPSCARPERGPCTPFRARTPWPRSGLRRGREEVSSVRISSTVANPRRLRGRRLRDGRRKSGTTNAPEPKKERFSPLSRSRTIQGCRRREFLSVSRALEGAVEERRGERRLTNPNAPSSTSFWLSVLSRALTSSEVDAAMTLSISLCEKRLSWASMAGKLAGTTASSAVLPEVGCQMAACAWEGRGQ